MRLTALGRSVLSLEANSDSIIKNGMREKQILETRKQKK